MDYDAFLRAKVTIAQPKGFDVDPAEINPLLKPHQVAAVIHGDGQRACPLCRGEGVC